MVSTTRVNFTRDCHKKKTPFALHLKSTCITWYVCPLGDVTCQVPSRIEHIVHAMPVGRLIWHSDLSCELCGDVLPQRGRGCCNAYNVPTKTKKTNGFFDYQKLCKISGYRKVPVSSGKPATCFQSFSASCTAGFSSKGFKVSVSSMAPWEVPRYCST